jgi:hypothetical protein
MMTVIIDLAPTVAGQQSIAVAVELGDRLFGVYVMLVAPGGLAHFLAAQVSGGLDWNCRPPGPFGHRT